ncbi:MAG: beta-lactamase family protein [Marinilabiliaceae bacterium]|nr:beta-lactamase family protein [Marinilabiliaceae bacterium]
MGGKTIIRLATKGFVTIAAGLIVWGATGFFNPRTESYGSDFTPPKNEPVSFRISGFFSNNSEFSYLEKRIGRFLRRENLVGASVAVAKDGKLIYAKGFGYADKENETSVEPYNLFRVASVSKLITAAGIMKLCEQGTLHLEDKVFGPKGILNDSIYLEYRDKRVEDITVLQLLNHSGGWTSRWGDQMFMPTIIAKNLHKTLPVDESDIIRFVLKKRLHFIPGEASYYSNLGYMILGQVVEKISHMSYEDYIQTHVLYPLGIFDMQVGGSYLYERAALEVKYYEPEETFFVDDHNGSGEQVLRSYGGNDMHTLGAAGGWIASSTDLMKLMLALDGFSSVPDILSESSINRMVEPLIPGYSPLGWRHIKKDGWYRTGTLAGTSALMVRHDNGISYVVLVNTGSWKGPQLANDIHKEMERGLKIIKEWPDYNLYELDNSMAAIRNRPQIIY